MNINLDFTPIQVFFSLPPDIMFWKFLLYFGWMILDVLFLAGFLQIWLIRKQTKYAQGIKYIYLAIDIPRGNEQTPKAVENIFTYFSGIHGSSNYIDKWIDGKFQLGLSLEIVSIEGYTQFIIRTPEKFRDLVESAIYSQYPNAEISEIDDYTNSVPNKYPDDEYDVWGSEFVHAQNDMLPIKTYEEFEDKSGDKETYFKDPMASLIDLCGSLGPGEQLWYQIILLPIGFDWMDKGDRLVDKILERKPAYKKSWVVKFVEWMGEMSENVIEIWKDVDRSEKDNGSEGLSMMNLTPKQKKQVEAIHKKTSKLAFETKVRVVYAAKKQSFNGSKVGNGFVGYMKQFVALDLNNLKPDVNHTMTKAEYFNQGREIVRKKNNIINNYIDRSVDSGRNPGILNIEELATLWHFPVEGSIQSSMLQKAQGRKAEAPSTLPMFDAGYEERGSELFNSDLIKEKNESVFDSENENGKILSNNNSMESNDFQGQNNNENKQSIDNVEEDIFSDREIANANNLNKNNLDNNLNEESIGGAEKKGAPPADLPFG
ncbi:hypothetical protein EOL94_02125 [bacterium]|nr:hypothetical protein [bacterium]